MKWSELDKAQRNALIAEKVMGLKVQWLDVVPDLPPVAVIVDENEIIKGNPPDYCDDINAAWSIVEKITEPPKTPGETSQVRSTKFMPWWEKANLWAMPAQEAARSICVKALELYGVEITE